MSTALSEVQNMQLGVLAAFIEGVILQPTLYWKNAKALSLPFTLNPKLIYRGTAASIFNEMQMMGYAHCDCFPFYLSYSFVYSPSLT